MACAIPPPLRLIFPLLLIITLLATGCTPQPDPPVEMEIPTDLPAVSAAGHELRAADQRFEVRGVNYLRPSSDDPVTCPRLQFGADGNCPWDLSAIQHDLDQLQSMGVNAVRLFLNFYAFGGASLTNPDYTMDLWLERLDLFIREANHRGIYVLPVLLTKYPQDRFAPEHYAMALELHVRPVVSHLAGTPGILAWDIFNEPDIGSPIDIRCWDWDNADFPLCLPLANERLHFLQAIHAEVKRLDPDRLTTVGLAFAKNYFEPVEADLALADLVDIYTFHYYDNEPFDSGRYANHWYYGAGFPADLHHAISELVALQPARPVIVTELGFPTDATATRSQADLQRDLRTAWQTAQDEQASGMFLWPFQELPLDNGQWTMDDT